MCKPKKLLRQGKDKICFVKDQEATFHESRKQSEGNQKKGIKNSKKELRGQ